MASPAIRGTSRAIRQARARVPSPDVKDKKLGLVLDIGAGLKVQPAVKAAVQKAAEAFEAAGAKVEPVAPFITQEIHEGLDRFFQVRLLADVQLLSAERRAKVL